MKPVIEIRGLTKTYKSGLQALKPTDLTIAKGERDRTGEENLVSLLLLQAAAEKSTRLSSMAKLFASEMAEEVCSAAIQVHGGYGYLEDFPVERIYRDVRVCQIYEGTSDIQRMIIGRRIAAA